MAGWTEEEHWAGGGESAYPTPVSTPTLSLADDHRYLWIREIHTTWPCSCRLSLLPHFLICQMGRQHPPCKHFSSFITIVFFYFYFIWERLKAGEEGDGRG